MHGVRTKLPVMELNFGVSAEFNEAQTKIRYLFVGL